MLKLVQCTAERAQNFKSQGNDNFKQRRFKEALAFYTQGLGDLEPELQQETRRTLWCNRAACNFELGGERLCSNLLRLILDTGNYRACLRDCASVLDPPTTPVPTEDAETHQKTTLKALFRCAKALLALEKLEDAQDALQRYRSDGGQVDPGIAKLERTVSDKIAYRDKIRAERAERERRIQESDEALSVAIKVSRRRSHPVQA